ncbi:zinc finger protein CONSTANS-LIKE 4-like [Arachis stenosperma]|uniref:zinc finger protein CONSTANS-LIKE 4-like n=1 Tax=Arachis stenosperma TaxID=217475 RepID=UPI0025ACB160|nr:zinc finger protein CONSTANS-LIKE 4-like [Arachis stenosperma]
MRKKCELCNCAANLFCDSDQASLCWECDAKVHSANFLVTKHPRILLCHVCQSLTPWHGSGPKFVPTMSLCTDCVTKNNDTCNHQNDDDVENDGVDGGEDEDEDEDEEEEEEEEEENQVVPWTSSTSMPPPPVSSSSNSATTTSTRFSNGAEEEAISN